MVDPGLWTNYDSESYSCAQHMITAHESKLFTYTMYMNKFSCAQHVQCNCSVPKGGVGKGGFNTQLLKIKMVSTALNTLKDKKAK